MKWVSELDPCFLVVNFHIGFWATKHSKLHTKYGVSTHVINEYCKKGNNIAMEVMKGFVATINACYELNYLMQSTEVDLVKQMKINKD